MSARGLLRLALAVALVPCALAAGPPTEAAAGAAPARLAATRELARRLAAGRGEVSIVQREADALGEVGPARHGTLALEPPDRMRLSLAGGEVLTVRADGGEWLQPQLGQMIRFGADGAGAATHLWGLLLGRGAGTSETARGPNRWKLAFAGGEALLDSAHLELGPDRLPRRIQAWPTAGGRFEARMSGWKFGHARGAAGFRQTAPKGVEEVPLGP